MTFPSQIPMVQCQVSRVSCIMPDSAHLVPVHGSFVHLIVKIGTPQCLTKSVATIRMERARLLELSEWEYNSITVCSNYEFLLTPYFDLIPDVQIGWPNNHLLYSVQALAMLAI